jgi:hypothetical protein
MSDIKPISEKESKEFAKLLELFAAKKYAEGLQSAQNLSEAYPQNIEIYKYLIEALKSVNEDDFTTTMSNYECALKRAMNAGFDKDICEDAIWNSAEVFFLSLKTADGSFKRAINKDYSLSHDAADYIEHYVWIFPEGKYLSEASKYVKEFTKKTNEKIMLAISEQIDPLLEEGKIYYSTPIVNSNGTSGGRVYCIKEGKQDSKGGNNIDDKLDEIKVEGIRDPMFKLTQSFPVNSRIKYTFQKGIPMKAEASTPTMIMEDWIFHLKEICKNWDSVKIETEVQFLLFGDELKKKGKEKKTKTDGSVLVSDKLYDENLKLMYYALEGKLKKLHFTFENDQLIVASEPGFPEWNIPEIPKKKVNLKLDASDSKAVFAFLESLDEQKIKKAITAIKKNEALKVRAEGRYLNLIRARLRNPKAGLEMLADPMVINTNDVNLMLGKNIDKDFISFHYMDDVESSFIVDYLGSMVRNAFSCLDLIEEMKKLKKSDGVKGITNIHVKYADMLHNWLKQETDFYSEGWFGQINTKLFGMCISRLLFEKTRFDRANDSPVKNEFVFFLNHEHHDAVFMDICQSENPYFGPMFWLLPEVPKTLWVDTELYLSPSVLSFERTASYKVGDGGSWKSMVSKK